MERDEAEEPLEQEALSPKERRLAVVLVLVSACDLLGSGTFAVVAFKYAYRDDGVSLYCLGIQALSHMFSSLVLVTRLMGDLLPARGDDGTANAVSDGFLLRVQRRRDLRREQAIAVTMALTMLLSCVGLLFKAFRKLQMWDRWYMDHVKQDSEIEQVTDIMAWWGFAVFLIQAVLRMWAGCTLRRTIIWHTFVISLVNLVFFFVLGLAASYEREWSWKAEPVCAMCLVVVMLCEGIRMVIMHLGDVDTILQMESRA